MPLSCARTICAYNNSSITREHFKPLRCLHKHSGSEWDERESESPCESDVSRGWRIGVPSDRSSSMGWQGALISARRAISAQGG